ncbi:MAG: copper chaperone PCu(A)C [Hyphomicrobiaceae bacterium]
MNFYACARASLAALASVSALLFAASDGVRAHGAAAGTVSVAHPWTRATPPGATVGAAYFEIKADAKGSDTLISARSPAAGRAEIHISEKDGDVMRMRQIERLEIKAGQTLVFGPAGHHVMLVDLVKPLQEGDLIEIELNFAKAGKITLEATVEPIGARGPHGMDHQPGHDAHKHH